MSWAGTRTEEWLEKGPAGWRYADVHCSVIAIFENGIRIDYNGSPRDVLNEDLSLLSESMTRSRQTGIPIMLKIRRRALVRA